MGIVIGFALTLLAGTMMGGNLVPLKWTKTWKWENFWFVYSIVSLLIVPFLLAFLFIPHLGDVYSSVSNASLIRPFLYGVLWGVAQLGSGICVDKIGLALTGSILNGLCATFGSLFPLFTQHSEMLGQASGKILLVGMAVMLLGVVLCGWAGYQREHTSKTNDAKSAASNRAYWLVMILAVVSGVFASLLNISLAYGGEIVHQAQSSGASPQWAVFAVWPLALAGGLVINLIYSVYLLAKNHTWANFGVKPREVAYPILGGSLWMIAIAIYSSATVFLGILGVSVGWAVFQITLILVGNFAGILTGEWRSSPPKIFRVNIAGVAILFLATVIMALANYSAG